MICKKERGELGAPPFFGNRLIRFWDYQALMPRRDFVPALLLAVAAVTGCQGSAPVSMDEVQAAIADNRFLDAREALLEWRAVNGQSPENSALLAQVMIELGSGYTAERYLSEFDPDSGARAEWMSLRARSLILQGKPWKARELIEQAAWPGSREGERKYLLVWTAMEEGRNEDAIALVDQALRLYPENAGLHAKAARLAVWQDNWNAAERHVEAALASDPDCFEALLLLGESQIARGELEPALQTYQLAVQTYPDFAVPRANVVGLLLDLERFDDAGTALDAALQVHPDFPQLRYNAARLSAIRGRWNDAREIVQALPSQWKQMFPAAIILEADIEAARGNHAIARTLYSQLKDEPLFAGQVLAKLEALPPEY